VSNTAAAAVTGGVHDELLTVAQVAGLAKCSERTVRRLMGSGRLRFVWLGTERRIPRAEWRRFIGIDSAGAGASTPTPAERTTR
jgi:excisionase family DNA binding protein